MDDLATITLPHDQPRRLPASPSKCSCKGPPKFGCTNARPSKCWALCQNMPASSSGQLRPQDPTFSSHKSFPSAGAWSIECEYSYIHSCGVCTTCKVAGFLGGVTGQWETQVSHTQCVLTTEARSYGFHWVYAREKGKGSRVRPQARAEGACPVLLPLLHSAPSLRSLQPASTGLSKHTVLHTTPRALAIWPDRGTGSHQHGTRTPPQLLQVPAVLTRFSMSSWAPTLLRTSTNLPVHCLVFSLFLCSWEVGMGERRRGRFLKLSHRIKEQLRDKRGAL